MLSMLLALRSPAQPETRIESSGVSTRGFPKNTGRESGFTFLRHRIFPFSSSLSTTPREFPPPGAVMFPDKIKSSPSAMIDA